MCVLFLAMNLILMRECITQAPSIILYSSDLFRLWNLAPSHQEQEKNSNNPILPPFSDEQRKSQIVLNRMWQTGFPMEHKAKHMR